MEHATKSCRRPPKSERRVHFADSMGMDLKTIFLIDILKLLQYQNLQHHHHQPQLQYQKQQYQQKQLQQQQQLLQQNNELRQLQKSDQQLQSRQQQQQHQHQLRSQTHQSILNQQQQQLLEHRNQPSSQPDQQNQNQHQHQHHQRQPHEHKQLEQNHPKPPATICQFTQPISLISFKERVRLNKVHLETCQVESRSAGLISVSCTIRVLNLAYEKAVSVRYTSDEWYTHTDCPATYKQGSFDGWSDKFICNFSSPIKGKRLMVAIQYTYGPDNLICWDNNGGFNYTIQILE